MSGKIVSIYPCEAAIFRRGWAHMIIIITISVIINMSGKEDLDSSLLVCDVCLCLTVNPDLCLCLQGDTGSGPSSRNASVERGGERQSDTSDSETTDVRKINQQPFSREGRYDPNRWVGSVVINTYFGLLKLKFSIKTFAETNIDFLLIICHLSFRETQMHCLEQQQNAWTSKKVST